MSGTAARDLLCTARLLLNDEKGVRYTDAALMKFLNMALDEVRAARPSEFIETIEVQAVPGDTQSVPEGFTFIEVKGAANADPSATSVSSTLDDVMAKRFGKSACNGKGSSTGGYAPDSAKAEGFDPRGFIVSPPAPEGVAASLEVRVINANQPDISIDECSPAGKQFDARLVDYMLFRAYAIQSESAYEREQATFYCNKFFNALDVNYQAVSRVKSQYIFGMDGIGNETVGTNRDLRGIQL